MRFPVYVPYDLLKCVAVKFLFTHHKVVQHLHKTSLCPRLSPETKATHTILALVSCFVFFYWTISCLTIYIMYSYNVQGLQNIIIFLSCCLPAIFPFVLLKSNNRRSFLNCAFVNMRQFSQSLEHPHTLLRYKGACD